MHEDKWICASEEGEEAVLRGGGAGRAVCILSPLLERRTERLRHDEHPLRPPSLPTDCGNGKAVAIVITAQRWEGDGSRRSWEVDSARVDSVRGGPDGPPNGGEHLAALIVQQLIDGHLLIVAQPADGRQR